MTERNCNADGCDRKYIARGYCGLHYQRWRKHGTIESKTLEERFWAKVKKTDSCWLWTACKSNTGYGQIQLLHKSLGSHRVSWELHNGKIPKGMFILHKCDVRACVNPSHLFLGTHKDNNDDKIKKGRQAKGEATNTAKLTDAKVIKIRSMYADGVMNKYQLAEMFKVDPRSIWNVIHHKTWNHV